MKTKTWVPGSNKKLDTLFNRLREEQYQNKNHRLWQNYSVEYWNDAGIVANTICFNDNNEPEICSTISNRSCWPKSAYRILNRTWKYSNKKSMMTEISQAMGSTTISQINWLTDNTDCKLYFISRQSDNWTEWVQNNFKRQFNLDFKIGAHKYLTCPNECDNTCWQPILYCGNEEQLTQWKHR
jgi:hypothetical protein